VARAPVTPWTDCDGGPPDRRGGTDHIRAPRNRDPREAEAGPLVTSCLDYLALQPKSSLNADRHARYRPVGAQSGPSARHRWSWARRIATYRTAVISAY
jgi:hypothetical protein